MADESYCLRINPCIFPGISPQVAVRSRGNEYLVLDPEVVQSVHQERVDTAAAMQHVAAQQSAVEHERFFDDLSTMALT
jgi:hypothetical protein